MKTTILGGVLTRSALAACLALYLAVGAGDAGAQPAGESSSASETSRAGAPGGIPLTQLIAAVAKSTGKKFLLDPRVAGNVNLVAMSPGSIGYADLLMILHLQGFAAVETGGTVWVAPDALARSMPSPLLTEKETRPDAETVTYVMQLKSSPAALLVPILRPLVPQSGHFSADTCNNTLLMVDTFANVKRIEAIVHRLDVGEPFKAHACDGHDASPPPPPSREPAPPAGK